MGIEDLRNRYVSLFGLESTEEKEIDYAEEELGVQLPGDFKEILKFYKGGMVGGISHFSIENIKSETKRLRDTVGLPENIVVLAEPPESLIIMNTMPRKDSPNIFWCDAIDVSRLNSFQGMHNPQTWLSYTEFFDFLLATEIEEREG